MSKVGQGGGNIRPPQEEGRNSGAVGGADGQAGGQAGAPSVATDGHKRVMSAADVERLASQAGFARTGGKKNKRGLDLGDSSQAPIPLPEDDLEGAELNNGLNYESLDAAQSQLLHHKSALGRSQKKGLKSLLGFWQALVAGEGTGDDDEDADDARAVRMQALQAMASETPPDGEAMAAMAQSVREQFGIDLSGEAVGPQMMAASLLVAGEQSHVAVAEGSGDGGRRLDAERLFAGAGRVIDAGREAADDARSRADGMQRSLSFQRTFVPKR